jgi:hypothetical protein
VPAGASDERLIPDTSVGRLQAVFEHSPDLRAHLQGRLAQGGDVVDRYRITFGKIRADSAAAAKKADARP